MSKTLDPCNHETLALYFGSAEPENIKVSGTPTCDTTCDNFINPWSTGLDEIYLNCSYLAHEAIKKVRTVDPPLEDTDGSESLCEGWATETSSEYIS